MKTKINEEIIIAYFNCKLKAFLLMNKVHGNEKHDYHVEIEERRNTKFKENSINYSKKELLEYFETTSNFDLKERRIHFEDLSTRFDNFTIKEGKSQRTHLEPVQYLGTHKPIKDDKVGLQFKGYILSKIQRKIVKYGKLVCFDGKETRINLANSYQKLELIIEECKNTFFKEKNAPLLLLKPHCTLCEFKDRCLKEAKDKSCLSLLSKINTEKNLLKYHKKGIFGLHQLSCLYKPRRRNKKIKKGIVKHNFELQALALKENKIYIKEEPKVKRDEIEIFLDIEAIPDEDFYYLFGICVKNQEEISFHYYWSDTIEDEKEAWIKCLNKIRSYPKAKIYHYGNFENKVFDSLASTYNIEIKDVNNRLINVNKYIFGKIYFPTYSNGLKDISSYLKLDTETEITSGLNSIVYRYKWENSRNSELKYRLVEYNKSDCIALMLLLNKLTNISTDINASSSISIVSQPRKNATQKGILIHSQLETILKLAHENYDKNKISLNKESKSVKTNKLVD